MSDTNTRQLPSADELIESLGQIRTCRACCPTCSDNIARFNAKRIGTFSCPTEHCKSYDCTTSKHGT